MGYFAELMTINEQVHESLRPLLRLSREIIRMRPRSGSPFRINPGFSIKRIEKRTVKYRVPVMEILMKMFFVLSFVPLAIAAAIAQQSATSGPDTLTLSPRALHSGSSFESYDVCRRSHVRATTTGPGRLVIPRAP